MVSKHTSTSKEKKVIQLQKQGKRIPSNRTVSLYLGSIRHLFNEAKKKYNDYDRNIILIPHSPFEHVEVPKQETTRKQALAAETINQILKLPYIYNANGKERIRPFNLAKDSFILSFCLIGMNSVDLHSCNAFQDNTITYNRSKTTGRRLDKAKMKVKFFLSYLFSWRNTKITQIKKHSDSIKCTIQPTTLTEPSM